MTAAQQAAMRRRAQWLRSQYRVEVDAIPHAAARAQAIRRQLTLRATPA